MKSPFDRFLPSAPKARQRKNSRPKQNRELRLQSEKLESRTLLAITTFPGGPVSNYLIVTSSPDAPNQAADDVFITRTATGDLLVANNSSFSPLVLNPKSPPDGSNEPNFSTPDILFVTNGVLERGPGPMQPGDNRGANYQQDAMLNRSTFFTLRHGAINSPEYDTTRIFVNNTEVLSRVPVTPNPYAATDTTNELGWLINGRIFGKLSYDGGEWDFEVAPSGNFFFKQNSAPATVGLAPVSGGLVQGDQDSRDSDAAPDLPNNGRGRGERGGVEIIWNTPVATVEHQKNGQVQLPAILKEITYTADREQANSNGLAFRVSADYPSQREFSIKPSAAARPEFQFDAGAGGIIPGTLSGKVTVRTVTIGDSNFSPEDIVFRFRTDLRSDVRNEPSNTGIKLYFENPFSAGVGEQEYGEVDWLRVRGVYAPDGTIKLEFQSRYDGDGSDRNVGNVVRPGPVTLSDVSFATYVTPALPNDFTLFAGYDLPSQLWVDLRSPGSEINIDSPVIVQQPRDPDSAAAEDIDLRATKINFNARVASTDGLNVSASRSGAVAETVTLNANVLVPNRASFSIADEPATGGSGRLPGPTRGQLLVSQSGSIAASFFTNAPPFGDSAVRPISVEAEPNDDGVAGASAADLPFAQDLSGSFNRVGDNTFQSTVNGSIAAGNGKQDFYKVPLRANDVLEIRLDGISLSDPLVRLFDGAGAPLGVDDDSGSGLNSLLTYTNGPTDRLVYIAADSFGSTLGSYRMTVTVRGAAAVPTKEILVTAESSDVFVEGSIFGSSQSYLMRSPNPVTADQKAKLPFILSTKSARTGADVGQIRGNTLQVILANDASTPLDLSIAYNTVDLTTAVDSLRVRASVRQNGVDTSPSGPFPYNLSIREENAIAIDAVAASTLPISIESDGTMTWTAAFSTFGDVSIRTERLSGALRSFVSTAPIETKFGKISITASEISAGSTLAVTDALPDPTRTDISLNADNGNITLTGLVSSPNRVSLVQSTPGGKSGRVAGAGRIKTRDLAINAVAIGNPSGTPTDGLFYLRTDVDSLTADLVNGAAIDEKDDIAITQLRSPSGLVAIRAAGTDGRPGSPNDLALSANLLNVTNLFVTAPNGSIDLRNDTAQRLLMGMPLAIQQGTAESMRASGNVTIISSAGGFDILDAPVAGSGARQVAAATVGTLPGAYDPRTPGEFASRITADSNGSINELRSLGGALDGVTRVLRVNDRVLVKNGVAGNPGSDSRANGVYFVSRLGGAGQKWELVRAADSDTLYELPTNTVVYNTDKNEFVRLSHGMTTSSQFGTGNILVEGADDGFEPTTIIGSSLVTPENTIQYVVSSTNGTNPGAGSLGKMISLRQRNEPVDPEQVQNFAFSSLISEPITLRQELPQLTKAFSIDGLKRFTPAGFTPASRPVTVNGQLISQDSFGASLYRGTAGATVNRLAPQQLTLSASFTESAELRQGMSVSGIGIRPGTTISGLSTTGGRAVVTLDSPVEAIFNRRTGSASLSVTFATELTGFHFVDGSAGGEVANLNVGGFETGSAIKVETSGIAIKQMTVGSDGAGGRLGSQAGVFVTGANGSAAITGGTITSSTVAGIRTAMNGAVSVVGAVVGTQALPNINGIEINGTGGATIGAAGQADTFVQFNRNGIVLRAGSNTVTNTVVSNNSFDGISIEGGSNTIGTAARSTVSGDSNVIYSNSRWGLNILSTATRSLQRVFGNIFGSDPAQTTKQDNGGSRTGGNIGLNGAKAGKPYSPNGTTALDDNGNQHGLRSTSTPGPRQNSVRRPWRARR
ncbi:MAG: hypothetical protein ACK48S_04735 [Planctomycetia bacterium]